jgi:hypothetical protein
MNINEGKTCGDTKHVCTNGTCEACTAPGVPTGVSAMLGVSGLSATVSWTAPTSNGGCELSGFTVHEVNGKVADVAASANATSAAVSGLQYSQSYQFTVAATNSVGTGTASGAAMVSTCSPPGTPTGVSASLSGLTANVSWTAPAANGCAITGYTVHEINGKVGDVGATASPAAVTGLKYQQSYQFKVSATNAAGTGPASSASSAVTPQCTTTTQTVHSIASASVQYGTVGTVTVDDNLYAYKQANLPSFDYNVVGWALFDLSPFSQSALITSATLSLNFIMINQGGSPQVQVLYSPSVGWTRGTANTSSIPPSSTSAISSPAGPLSSTGLVEFTLNSHDWSADLAAGKVAIGLASIGTAGYDQFWGSDPPSGGNPPPGVQPTMTIVICQ